MNSGQHGWEWLRRDDRPPMGCLVFARDVDPDRIIELYGMEQRPAGMLSAEEAQDVFSFPDPESPYLRLGQIGEWTFAIDATMLSTFLAVKGRNIGKQLSSGTETVVISWTEKPTEDVKYWRDGILVTSVEPYRAWDRTGSDRDRFVAEMRRVGLETEPPRESGKRPHEERPQDFDPLLAALEALTLALGIQLPQEVAEGPLLTLRRGPDNQAGGTP
jgi:Family of unknown function (DUF6461)